MQLSSKYASALLGFSGGPASKESNCGARDLGSVVSAVQGPAV